MGFGFFTRFRFKPGFRFFGGFFLETPRFCHQWWRRGRVSRRRYDVDDVSDAVADAREDAGKDASRGALFQTEYF